MSSGFVAQMRAARNVWLWLLLAAVVALAAAAQEGALWQQICDEM